MGKSCATAVETEEAPRAIGPYSQAVAMQTKERLIFVSGLLPIDPATGKLLDGDISAMTRRILTSLKAILEKGGSSLEQVVRVEIFCTDMKDFVSINAEYAQHFTGPTKPARQTVQVAALPMGAQVEISCIATIDS